MHGESYAGKRKNLKDCLKSFFGQQIFILSFHLSGRSFSIFNFFQATIIFEEYLRSVRRKIFAPFSPQCSQMFFGFWTGDVFCSHFSNFLFLATFLRVSEIDFFLSCTVRNPISLSNLHSRSKHRRELTTIF